MTLVEVSIGAAILGVIVITWSGFVQDFSRFSKRGRHEHHLAKENMALVNLMRTIPRRAVDMIACTNAGPLCPTCKNGPRPHPYRWINPATGRCEDRGNPDKGGYINATAKFADSLWDWPNKGTRYVGNTDRLDLTLNKNYFNNTLVPLISKAGCLDCHGGPGSDAADLSPPWLRNCNFTNYNHVTGTGCFNPPNSQPPLAGKFLFLSRLGQLFLPNSPVSRNRFTQFLQNFLYNPRANPGGLFAPLYAAGANINVAPIQNFVFFQTVNLNFGGGGFSRQLRQVNGCRCSDTGIPLGCGCVVGTLEPGSCIESCTNWSSGRCSCGKGCTEACPPTCNGTWVANFFCVVPGAGNLETVSTITVSSRGQDPDPTRGADAVKQINNTVVAP